MPEAPGRSSTICPSVKISIFKPFTNVNPVGSGAGNPFAPTL